MLQLRGRAGFPATQLALVVPVRQAENGNGRRQQQALSRERIDITGEAKYIIERARNFDTCIVTLGPLVLFSTETGDAWMLDPQDGLALCLAMEREEQPFTIAETSTNFSVEWGASYERGGSSPSASGARNVTPRTSGSRETNTWTGPSQGP
jgi:hypothetical protein